MALTFPISPAGLEVDGLVNLESAVGMDVIRVCKMNVDGPAGLFTLEQ